MTATTPRWIVSELSTERHFGPRIRGFFVPARFEECPKHPRPIDMDPRERLADSILGGGDCACVIGLDVVLSWWWGNREWFGVVAVPLVARLHPLWVKLP